MSKNKTKFLYKLRCEVKVFICYKTVLFCRQIRDLIQYRNTRAWLGLSDRSSEGDWRFPGNLKRFDTRRHENVFRWAKGQPDNRGNNDCAYVGYKAYNLMDDGRCATKMFGLCEIKVVDCDANVEYV